jgi:hypothetical protein
MNVSLALVDKALEMKEGLNNSIPTPTPPTPTILTPDTFYGLRGTNSRWWENDQS